MSFLPVFLRPKCIIPLSIVTSQNPTRLSKGFLLSEEGKLQKLSGGQLIDGTIETKKVENVKALANLLIALKPNQALCYGISAHPNARIVPKKDVVDIDDGGLPVIARTRDNLSYPPGPAVMILDHDFAENRTKLDILSLLKLLYDIWHELKSAPHVARPSASSCINNGEQELRGVNGIRVWVVVANGHDIPRAGKAFYERSWLKGNGHTQISSAGSILNRSIVDACVYQPERLDFSGGADCTLPLTQQLPEPHVFNNDSAPIRTDQTLLDLNPEETILYDRLVSDARREEKPKAKIIRDTWVEKQVDKITSADQSFAGLDTGSKEMRIRELRLTYRNAAENNVLGPDFQIILESGDAVLVSAILDEPEKYQGQHCADPLEPDYHNDSRIGTIFVSGRNVHIWSFAHGGQRYNLSHGREIVYITPGSKSETIKIIADFIRDENIVFTRGSELVNVAPEGKFRSMDAENLGYYLDSSISFQKFSTKNNTYVPCDCPPAYAKTLYSQRLSLGFPELETVITAPILDPATGRIIDKDGYDKKTRIYLISNDLEAWPGVPDDPSDTDVKNSIDFLWYPFKDFSFCESIDRAVALSAILTVAIRSMLPTAPAISIDAPAAGTGKTLFCRSLSVMGGDVTSSVYPGIGNSEEELRKRIMSVLREDHKVIIFDNLTGQVASPALCAMLTSEHFSDRILGISQISKVSTRVQVLFNGNNISFQGDLCRRILTARIDPSIENPWNRRFDINPVSYVAENRLKLIAAVLTILRAARKSGFVLKDSLASYEVWSDIIRTAVVWVGGMNLLDVIDPIESITQSYDNDLETTNLGSFLASWFTAFGSTPKTVAECIAYAKTTTQTDAMYDILENVTDETGKEINPKKLGRWISKVRGRIVDGMKFDKLDQRHNVTRWKVTQIDSDDAPQHVSDPFDTNTGLENNV